MYRKAIFPGCYYQGEGLIKDFAGIDELKDKRVFLLTTRSGLGIIEENADDWQKICHVEHALFCGECTFAEIDRICDLLKDRAVDYLAALGGGKVMDAARTVAGYIHNHCLHLTPEGIVNAMKMADAVGRRRKQENAG